MFLSRGVNLDAYANAALASAAKKGRGDIVKLLEENGAKLRR
jgi:hypothetical protein